VPASLVDPPITVVVDLIERLRGVGVVVDEVVPAEVNRPTSPGWSSRKPVSTTATVVPVPVLPR